MEFKYLPKDILSPVFSLVDPEDLVWVGLCGDKEFMERLSSEGLVSSVTLTDRLGYDSAGTYFPFSALTTPAFSSLTRIIIHYEAEDQTSWLWDPCFLPSTITEMDFSIKNAFEVFLQPLRDANNPHWMRQPMYSNHQTSPEQLFAPMLLCEAFPKLEKLRISGSLFSGQWGFPVHWGLKRPYRDLLYPTLAVSVNWTKAMFWLFLKKLPSSLTSLDLSISADILEEVPELPPNLTCLRYCEGVAPATHTPRFWLKLPESHRPDLSTLPNFQWDYYSIPNAVADKFTSEIGLFNNVRSLDISKVHLQSAADIKLLPRYLTHLKCNFHSADGLRSTLKMSDVLILPRTITHLTLIECPLENADAKDFCSLLPPNLTYFCLRVRESWDISFAFSEMRSSLRHLQTLIIDARHLDLDTFDPWLPCDILHTLEIISHGSDMIVDPGLFSSWPNDIPNNIKRLKVSLSSYGGDEDPIEDEHLQKLPPQLTSLSLDGRFLISPSFFGSLPKSVISLELLSTCQFTHRLREKHGDEADDEGDNIVTRKDNEEEEKEEEEEVEEEEEYENSLTDAVIVRHCPQHIELHMECFFTGAFFPPNVTKLRKSYNGFVEAIPRSQLPNQLRYCNLRCGELDSNCIIPYTLTELYFDANRIDMELASKIPNLQRLSGNAIYPMDLEKFDTFTSLKYLRLFTSLDQYHGAPNKGNQCTSLQELVLQSAWIKDASTYKLSQFPNITSLKIVDHKTLGGKPRLLLFPTTTTNVPNNKIGGHIDDAGCTTPQQLLPILSKLQRLEVMGDDLIITQSQLKHMTPNLTFLTIGSVSIDNLKEIHQSLTPDIAELTSEIEIIKAICPSITTLGTTTTTPPPKILFLGKEISFPVDCKALLDETQVEKKV